MPSAAAQHVLQGMYSPRSRNKLPAVTLLQYEVPAASTGEELPPMDAELGISCPARKVLRGAVG
jgi:hypothetical protein